MGSSFVRGRVLVAAVSITLVGSGCAWLREATQPVPGAAFGTSDRSALSGDGRYLAYAAASDTSSPGTSFGVYRYDSQTGVRTLVSKSSAGPAANAPSGEPVIDSTGRYVAFSSDADNLVPNDTNGLSDVFVRDLAANTTTRVSVTSTGAELPDDTYTPSISADGRYVSFISDTDIIAADSNGASDAYVHDRVTNANVLASIAGGVQTDFGVSEAIISGNGLFVAFTTDTDLVNADQNASDDVYVRNLAAKTTARISKPKSGLVEDGGGDSPSISNDGRYVAFVGGSDIDGISDPYPGVDAFVRDTVGNTVARVSVSPTGGPIDGNSSFPQLSADGSRVAYVTSGNPTGADSNGAASDVVVRDRVRNRTIMVSTDMWLAQLPAPSSNPIISGDGRYAGFQSDGAFDPNDSNHLVDAFLRSLDVPYPTSVAPSAAARGTSVTLTITGSGFLSGASLVPIPDVLAPTSVVVNSDTKITATISVMATAPRGLQNVYIQNPGSGPGANTGAVGRCSNCLNIT